MRFTPGLKLIIFTLLLLSSCKKDNSPDINILSSKLFGGTLYDCGNDIINTEDGGLALLGSVMSPDGDVTANRGSFDFWLLKMDNQGSKVWQKSFGGSLYDWANALVQSPAGDYVMAGYTKSNDGDVSGNHNPGAADVWVIQADIGGTPGWKFTWGGTAEDNATDIIPTADGGYLICGYTLSVNGDLPPTVSGSDGFILKLNSSGVKQWQKIFGGAGTDKLYSLSETDDGCFIASGYSSSTDGVFSNSHGASDAWIVKIDQSGSLKWQKLIGTANNEVFTSIIQTPDGGFAASGAFFNTNLSATSYDFLVTKLDSLGNEEWTRYPGGNNYDNATSLTISSTGKILVTGITGSADIEAANIKGGYDILVITLGMDGTISSQKRCGGSANDNSSSIIEFSTGSYAIAGFSSSSDGDLSGNHGEADCWVLRMTE
jgi:hypothetical protein